MDTLKIDTPAIGGIVFAAIALVGGFTLEGGAPGILLQVTAAVIVIGGTIGATVISYSVSDLKQVPSIFRMALTRHEDDPVKLIDDIARYADIARKSQSLALEPEIAATDNPFIKKGLQMIVDNTDPEILKQVLEADMYAMATRQKTAASIFESAGGYAPTMGIIGTVMGLVHVLGSLGGSTAQLGSSISLAFIATLYGVSSANIVWLPLANNLKNKSKQSQLVRLISVEGLLLVQKGTAPTLIFDRLLSFINPSMGSVAEKPKDATKDES